MIGRDYLDVPAEPFAEGITVRWLLGKQDGAPNFAMRAIEFAPGVAFGPHEHPYEHEIYVLEGEGVADGAEGSVDMRPGVALFIAPGEAHGYRNSGDEPLRMICVIPHQPD